MAMLNLQVAVLRSFTTYHSGPTAVHNAIRFYPYYLVFGHSPMLPVDVMLDCHYQYGTEGEKEIPQFVEEIQRYLQRYRGLCHCKQPFTNAHHCNKQKHDQKEHGETVSIGDRVSLYVLAVKTG